jgi:D-galactonate transporter
MTTHQRHAIRAVAVDGESAVYRKVSRRLIPFLFVLYLVAFLDRVNVGFAKLQMSGDFGFGEAVYGMGAGIFFLGYFLFEVPSNIILHHVGAKRWIARILLVWGLISAAMMFVDSAASFYLLRFLLGVGEAGFFPGVILYLTYWFPARRRAKTTASFMTAIAVAGVVGGPLSGWIMAGLDGWQGLRGWQWLFLLEGLPAVLLGFAARAWLDDGPAQAGWLDEGEKRILLRRLDEDHEAREAGGHGALREAFASARVWLLALVYFCLALGLYGVSFWLPQIVNDLKQGGLLVTGWLSALPYAVAALAMVAVAQRSDLRRERRWHIAGSALLGGLGLVCLALVRGSPALSIAALAVATSGFLSALSIFWALPTAFLSGRAAAGGIALINCVGSLGGYFGPVILGWVRQSVGNMDAGLYVLAGGMALAAALVLGMGRDGAGRF